MYSTVLIFCNHFDFSHEMDYCYLEFEGGIGPEKNDIL